jgi:hypothetical protein
VRCHCHTQPVAAANCVLLLQVVLAMHDIADELVAKVKAGVAKLSVGRPEDNADITPVVSEASANFIQVGWLFCSVVLCGSSRAAGGAGNSDSSIQWWQEVALSGGRR